MAEKRSKMRRRHHLCGRGERSGAEQLNKQDGAGGFSSHSPPLVHAVVGGVVEAGNGVAGRHHELTLWSAVGDQAVCRRDNRRRQQPDSVNASYRLSGSNKSLSRMITTTFYHLFEHKVDSVHQFCCCYEKNPSEKTAESFCKTLKLDSPYANNAENINILGGFNMFSNIFNVCLTPKSDFQ